MGNTFFLLSILLGIAVLIWATRVNRGRGRKKREKVDHRTRQDRAVWAWAKIQDAKTGPVNAGGQAQVDMQLEVHLPGTPAYPAATTWLVDQAALGYVETGKEISVKVDPQGTEFIYPQGPWAKFKDGK